MYEIDLKSGTFHELKQARSKSKPMKANEHLQSKGIEECPECHCSTEHDDWEYKDFTCKTVAICPQCHEEIYLGYD